MNRRSFIKGLLSASTVTAAGLIIPEQATKLIFDLGANKHLYTTPWELVRVEPLDFAHEIGYAFKRMNHGKEEWRGYRQLACEHRYIHRSPAPYHVQHAHPEDVKGMLTALESGVEPGKIIHVLHRKEGYTYSHSIQETSILVSAFIPTA